MLFFYLLPYSARTRLVLYPRDENAGNGHIYDHRLPVSCCPLECLITKTCHAQRQGSLHMSTLSKALTEYPWSTQREFGVALQTTDSSREGVVGNYKERTLMNGGAGGASHPGNQKIKLIIPLTGKEQK